MAEKIGSFKTTKVYDNEIVKALDMNYAYKSVIDNCGKVMQMLVEAEHDVIIGGKVEAHSGGGFNIVVNPIAGVCVSDNSFFGDSELSDAIAVPHVSNGPAKVYTVEVRAEQEDFDEQSRAFEDLSTAVVTYQNVNTKTQVYPVYHVFADDDTPTVAPDHTTGWVKLAEIHVPSGVSEIRDYMIKNITADVPEENENEEWTNESDATFNPGRFTDVRKLFRVIHDDEGYLVESAVGAYELDTGVGEYQVNGDILPIGHNVEFDDETVGAENSIITLCESIIDKVQDLLNTYVKVKTGNDVSLARKLKISDKVTEGILTMPLELAADGTGLATVKLNNTVILKITQTGKIEAPNLSANTSDLTTDALVTRVVTNELKKMIEGLGTSVATLAQRVNSVNVNSVMAGFSIPNIPEFNITLAATDPITNLSGTITVDDVPTKPGDIILVAGQSDKKQNGIYIITDSTGDWTRHSDFTADNSLCNKYFIPIAGLKNARKVFVCTNDTYATGVTDIIIKESMFAINESAYKGIMRDSNGRAKINDPVEDKDIVNKQYLDERFESRVDYLKIRLEVPENPQPGDIWLASV